MSRLYKAIVIGTSAGGLEALSNLFSNVHYPRNIATIVVQHLSPNHDSQLAKILNNVSQVPVKQANDKESILPGNIYLAPPNYHLLIEKDYTFSLSAEEKLNFSRPAIDILFDTAADAFKSSLIGVLLTGANSDGAKGLQTIKHFDGYTIVQSPSEAYAKAMPESALKRIEPDCVLNLQDIADKLKEQTNTQDKDGR